MKKILIAALAFAAAGSAMAASTNPLASPAADAPAAKTPYVYELGVSTHRELYEEFADGDKLMQEEAIMTTIRAGVSRAIGDTGGTVVLSGQFGFGKGDYTGSYMDGKYGDLRIPGLKRTLVDVSAMYKQTAESWAGLTAGAGIGYRRLVDNLQDGGPGGYKRINERTYLTASLERAIEFSTWTVTPGIQYKHILSSKQTSELYGGVTVDQPNGHGAEASIAFIRKSDGYRTVITPFFRIWDIKDSDVHKIGLYEPRNKTKEAGIAVTYQF
jgi:hypothetical protein